MAGLNKQQQLMVELVNRWSVPHQRIEDTFRIRNAKGKLIPFKIEVFGALIFEIIK